MKFKKPYEVFNLRELFKELSFATFVERLNRFCALVRTEEGLRKAHISDTGRLVELLSPGSSLLLGENPEGKLDYKLLAVKGREGWVFLYTPAHGLIAERLIKKGLLGFFPKEVKREVKYGRSRIDFLVDGDFYLEVKGCNLLKGKTCLFPDAPTERGRKHLMELIDLRQKGFRAGVLFLAFRDCLCFSPCEEIDPEFSEIFKRALSSGVEFFGMKLKLLPETGGVYVKGELPLC